MAEERETNPNRPRRRQAAAVAAIGAVTFLAGATPAPSAVPYPRPGGGTPLRVPLVPAFAECTTPNTTHAAPLDEPSCEPPVTESGQLTISTLGFRTAAARYDVIGGDPGTASDEADLRINAFAGDVRTMAGEDYFGEVLLSASWRVTDQANGTGAASGTVEDLEFSVPIGCVPTLSPIGGSACGMDTSADALVPGAIVEGRRSVVSTPALAILDAGPDGDATPPAGCPPDCGTGDERAFLTQGVFAP